jgi:hypothetical protein
MQERVLVSPLPYREEQKFSVGIIQSYMVTQRDIALARLCCQFYTITNDDVAPFFAVTERPKGV